MHSIQIGGQLGAFPDATGQPVQLSAFGTVSFEYGGDPNAVQQQLNNALMMAARDVIGGKLASNQVALPTLAQSLPYFVQEIVAQSGAQNLGVQITQLQLQVNVPQAAPPPQPMAMPPTPMQATANALGQAAANKLDPRNYEYEAKVNVGGFKIKASTDGGLDTDGLKKQAVDKAKSTVIWWAAGCLIVGLVVLGLVGLGGYMYYTWNSSSTTSTGPGKAAKWDGKTPFTCAGADNVKLEGVTANIASGTAITASGACKLELVNCNITAPVGIDASGSASVEVKGGSVTSTQFAAKGAANAKINFSGTKVSGKTQPSANAKITGI